MQEPYRTWQEDLHYQLRLGELQQQELANQAFLEEEKKKEYESQRAQQKKWIKEQKQKQGDENKK